MKYEVLLGLATTFGAGMLAQWLAWRFRLAAIVILFALGLLFGPVFGILHPSVTLGWTFRPIISLLVALVVFEGGMALDIRQLREAGEGILRLTMIALPINWILGSLAAHYVAHFDWGTAFLFGAIVVVTGPTVVLPLLRHTKLQPRIAAFLRWEAIINDPIGAILAAIILQIVILKTDNGTAFFFTQTVPDMLVAGAEAIAAGIIPAYLVRYLFTRDLMPEIMKVPALLTIALLIFQLCTIEMDGAGLIAVTIFGMAVTNLHIPGGNELRRTKESLVVLIVSVLFILLTSDLQRSVLARVSWPILLLTLVMLFVVRPVGIFISTLGTNMSWQERLFLGWIAPRGIVAASVAGAIGIQLTDAGFKSGELIMPAVFALIAVTMICHGFSLRPFARYLKLTLSDEPALALLGANRITVDLADCLNKESIPVLIVDNNVTDLMAAAKAGIPVLKAELLSTYGQVSLEERPADYLVAMTGDNIYNGMVCGLLAPNMGRQRVYQISPGVARLDYYRGVSRDARGKIVGEPSWSYSFFDTLYSRGWRFVAKKIEKDEEYEFGVDENRYDILLVRRGSAIIIRSAEDIDQPTSMKGDYIVSLQPVEQEEAKVSPQDQS
ncbi:sodium:proton antiporter [Aristophania vespae]|uniref:Sodium:proton antiporter n=1 Tax=Aristophania vespae TaxID=2697033 RepID=A0A6P1NDA1_9PROT|nr:sodium:proton antiporter [Aristophania vespae]QHI95453.1 sodium:proton antiporter [Aristophania vespae]UMM64751.1 K(+)/H(+) antiporter NhaP2 [Aristophania vespae]